MPALSRGGGSAAARSRERRVQDALGAPGPRSGGRLRGRSRERIQRELVAAVAAHEVRGAEFTLEQAAEFRAARRSPPSSAQPLVQVAELVHVQEDQAEAQGVAPGPLELLPDAAVERVQQ